MTGSKSCACGAGRAAHAETAPGRAGNDATPTVRSRFRIPGMDCPSEEQMIRLRLADLSGLTLEFDLPARRLVVLHGGDAADILARLTPLGFGAELEDSQPLPSDAAPPPVSDDAAERRTLWTLLALNALMFVVEGVAGWLGHSAGLIADGADMFADAAVYGVALYAVGRSAARQHFAARLAGVLQLALAIGALAEVGRRALSGGLPEEITMMSVALLALAVNVACLALISRHRTGGVHMRASYIFSANDVLANLGVIAAGALVAWTGSPLPDWVIGALIGTLVLVGALRILRLR